MSSFSGTSNTADKPAQPTAGTVETAILKRQRLEKEVAPAYFERRPSTRELDAMSAAMGAQEFNRFWNLLAEAFAMGPRRTIPCNFGDIEIHSETEFSVSEFAQYGSYSVQSTADLSSIETILNTPDWTEEALNEAVAELAHDPEARREEWQAERRAGLRWNNEEDAK